MVRRIRVSKPSKRKGLGRGLGKGYKNLIPKDTKVHSDSAKGRKQPQKIPLPTLIEQSKKIKDPIAKLRGKQIVIRGKRWFDKINGNTYHSTEVYIDGKLVGRVPFAYGYGNQFYTTGKQILADKGFIEYEKTKENVPVYGKDGKIAYYTPKESKNKQEAFNKFEDYRYKNRDKVLVFVDDVQRKKDL